jgi:hypothetical protein
MEKRMGRRWEFILVPSFDGLVEVRIRFASHST